VFTWSCPSGTTLDIEYDAYVENLDASYSLTGASGLTVGANYRWGIDGLPTASTNYVVVGFRRA
jgi:hypothetical protein